MIIKNVNAYRCAVAALLSVALALTAACAGQAAVGMPSAGAAKQDYRVQPGDILFISVWREETLQREVTVQPDGAIRFPLAGQVNASGLTLTQIEERLKTQLSKYIPDPAVSVSLLRSLGNRIYVVGRVNKPGEFVLSGKIDVMQALALAGGMTPFADRSAIKILREENGKQRTLRFNYKEVEKGEGLSQNILLMPGDTIVVP